MDLCFQVYFAFIFYFYIENEKSKMVHQENRGKSPIWGGRIDKITGELIGKNKLGKIWMKVRDEL